MNRSYVLLPYVLPTVCDKDRGFYPYHTDGAIAGILLIGSLPKRAVLAAMKGHDNKYFRAILQAMGPKTNPNWITGECVERAYKEGWIDEEEQRKRQY